jgi:hypothetical protein
MLYTAQPKFQSHPLVWQLGRYHVVFDLLGHKESKPLHQVGCPGDLDRAPEKFLHQVHVRVGAVQSLIGAEVLVLTLYATAFFSEVLYRASSAFLKIFLQPYSKTCQ